VLDGYLVSVDQLLELTPVYVLEKCHGEHAVSAELVAVDGAFDALDNRQILFFSCQYP
jgi:hypothetical protein